MANSQHKHIMYSMKNSRRSQSLNFSRKSYWLFFVAFIVTGFIGLYSLRQNNLTSVRLRDELLQVDKDNGDVESALRTLREHIYSHMNADLSTDGGLQQPIQLKYRYERLVAAEKARVSAENSQIYTQAQVECEKQFPSGLSGSGRIPCIQQYVQNRGTTEQVIPDALYKFDFVSPAWSPDWAGLSLLASLVFLVMFFVGLFLDRKFRYKLRD